jgi:hypothetical protein
MFHYLVNNYWDKYESLSRAVTDAMWKQWRWLDSQCRFGMSMWGAVLGSPRNVGLPSAPKREAAMKTVQTPEDLEKVAKERLSKGLAPPREIYDVRNRDRIDWTNLPDWARSVDPELFEGCSHEG